MSVPKRFYQSVGLIDHPSGKAIALDGRVAKTVGRNDLVAGPGLAEAIAKEWEAQTDVIKLDAMPLTRLHGFVLDADDAGRANFIETIVAYAGSDLLCYRAEDRELARRQETVFTPFLDHARQDGFAWVMTTGMIPVEQPAQTLSAVEAHLEAMDVHELYPRKLLTEITGSAILALYAEKNPDNAFKAARLDEAFQAEKWGFDSEAEAKEKALRADYDNVLCYLELSST